MMAVGLICLTISASLSIGTWLCDIYPLTYDGCWLDLFDYIGQFVNRNMVM